MATISVAVRPASVVRPKYAVFTLIGLMLAYVLVHNESFLIHPKDPAWQHYHPFRWWLLPHGLAGACAILLGPMQFSDRLRQRFAKVHRVIGRIYVVGAFVVAPLGTYIQYFEERMGGPRSFSIAAAVDAALLMITTGIAFAFIRAGTIQQHRQWMTRSFAVAIVFLEVRVISGLGGWDNSLAATETIVWICIGFSVLLGDIALQVQEYLRTRPSFRKVQAASAD
ncbi:MAG TPA: DUF2306 domain-containing protein [Terriglobales bacterium]